MDSQLIAAIVGGVIGIVGSIGTLIASHLLRTSGRITVDLTRSSITLSKQNPDGHGEEVGTLYLDEAAKLNISLGMDIYNSSDIPRSLRDLWIEVKSKGKLVAGTRPSVLNDMRKSEYDIYRKLEIINLPPKALAHLDLMGWINVSSYQKLKGSLNFSFKAEYPNRKVFRVFRANLITLDLEKDSARVADG